MKKKYILRYALVAWVLLFIFFSAYKLAHPEVLCWDGMDIDENKLMQDCGVTPAEYWQKVGNDASFCPLASESMRPVGSCDPDYGMTVRDLVVPFVIWVVGLAVILVFFFKAKR